MRVRTLLLITALGVGATAQGGSGASAGYYPGAGYAIGQGSGSPVSLAVNDSQQTLWATDYKNNTVAVINLATGKSKVIADAVGMPQPNSIAVDEASGTAWVANTYSNQASVSRIDVATGTVTGTFGTDANPHKLAVNPADHRVWVPNFGCSTVWILDPVTGAPVTKAQFSSRPEAVVIDPALNRAYVSLSPDKATASAEVGVMDTVSGTVLKIITLKYKGLTFNSANGIAVNTATHRAYVPSSGYLVVLDTVANTVTNAIPVGRGDQDAAVDMANNVIYVTNTNDGTVSAIDGASETVVQPPVQLGSRSVPLGVTVNPTTHKAYVAMFGAGAVVRLDLDTVAPVVTISTANNSVLRKLPSNTALGRSDQVVGAVTDNASGIANGGVQVNFTLLGGVAPDGQPLPSPAPQPPTIAYPGYKVNSGVHCPINNQSCEWSAALPPLPGVWNVAVTATDIAGNTSAPVSILIVVVGASN